MPQFDESISLIAADNFDVINWVNDVLKEKADDESTETFLASLSMRLHLMSQDYTDKLETNMVESMSSTPRLVSDVNRIEDLLKSFSEEMNLLSSQLRTFDQRNMMGVEDLSRLDTFKSNMEYCKSTLEEHVRWGQIVKEAEKVMDGGGSLLKTADHLETMHRSLDLLKEVSGHDLRMKTCEIMSETLLATVRPRVRRTLLSNDLSQLEEFLYIYGKLQRREELELEYIEARPERLKASISLPSDNQLSQWLATFYGKVTGLLIDEKSHVETLFGAERVPKVLSFMLQKMLNQTIHNVNNEMGGKDQNNCSNNNFIELLNAHINTQLFLETYKITDEFVRRCFTLLRGSEDEVLKDNLVLIYKPVVDCLESYTNCEITSVQDALTDSIDRITNKFFDDLKSSHGVDNDNNPDFVSAVGEFSEGLLDSTGLMVEHIGASMDRSAGLLCGLKLKDVILGLIYSMGEYLRSIDTCIHHIMALIDDSSTSSNMKAQIVQQLKIEGDFQASSSGHALDLLPAVFRVLQTTGSIIHGILDIQDILITKSSRVANSIIETNQIPSNIEVLLTVSHESNNASSNAISQFYVYQMLQNNRVLMSDLRKFFKTIEQEAKVSNSPISVLKPLKPFLDDLLYSAGSCLVELCLKLPRKVLMDIHEDPIWSMTASEFADDVLPQLNFTQVGEHLLALVQELETFAGSSATKDLYYLSKHDSDLANKITIGSWERTHSSTVDKNNGDFSLLMSRDIVIPCIHTIENILHGSSTSFPDADLLNNVSSKNNGNDMTEEDHEVIAVNFVNDWLGAIADAIVGLVLSWLMRIPELSKQGRVQLAADLGYLKNVVSALGLSPHPILSFLCGLTTREGSKLQMNQLLQKGQGNTVVLQQLRDITMLICS